MSARDQHLDAILCHCGSDEIGHEPGADECAEQTIKTRSLTSFARTQVDQHAADGCLIKLDPVRGTCRECERRVKVVKVETHGTWDVFPRLPGETKASYDRRRKAKFGHAGVRGPLLQVMPAIAPHRDCLGAGQPPAETRCTPGSRLAEWTAKHGPNPAA